MDIKLKEKAQDALQKLSGNEVDYNEYNALSDYVHYSLQELSQKSAQIGDLKNKLIASQQEVIELRKAFANNQNRIQMLKKARCKKTWDCKEFDCLYKNE